MMDTLSLLANHLWQSTGFAAVAALLALTIKENRAESRFWLFLTASMMFLVPFSLLATIGSYFQWAATLPPHIQSGVLAVIEPFSSSLAPENLAMPEHQAPSHSWIWVTSWPGLLILIWLCGIFRVARLTYWNSRRVAVLARRATRLHQGREVDIMARLSRAQGLAQPIPILVSVATVRLRSTSTTPAWHSMTSARLGYCRS